MNKAKACQLWAQLCVETLGGNESGIFERITALGSVATSANLSLSISPNPFDQDSAEAVAQWLEAWARDIRGEAQPPKGGAV